MPFRGSLKGALAVLVLLMLALLLWQLVEQFQQTQERQHQRAVDYSIQLADRLSLNMALNAQVALNLLDDAKGPPQNGDQKASMLAHLRQSMPGLDSVVWLDADAKVTADSDPASSDASFLTQMLPSIQGRTYYYADARDSASFYLFVRQPGASNDRYWVLRGEHTEQAGASGFRWHRFAWEDAYPTLKQRLDRDHPGAVEPATNFGRWRFEPDGGGVRGTYSVCTSAGGSIPRWLQNRAARQSLPGTMRDVLTEARRRMKAESERQ